MKHLYTALTLILIAIPNLLKADYSTPGNGSVWSLDSLVQYSGGVVTHSGGVYFVNDTLTISLSDTLKVDVDFIVKLSSQVFIDIFGVMKLTPPVQGVITAADTSQKFLGLKFEDQSDGSVISKTIFEYGNGIRMLDCNILIDSCTIRFNTLNSTFSSSAINLFRSNSTISNCKIYRNRRAAIAGGANIANSPRILNNHIFENDTENFNVPQINFGASSADTLVIRGNVIRGLFDNCGGISLLPVGSIPIALIENNVIAGNRYGIAIGGGNSFVIIRGNRIDSNNIQGNPNLGGSGINFNGTATQVSIVTGNTIRNNLWGITIQGTAKPNMGNIGNISGLDDGRNSIYGNGNSGIVYDLYNNTPDSIKAENNWWGTDNLDSIEAHIFHRPDSSTLGVVDYLPIGTMTSAEIPLTSFVQSYLLSSVYPNPFNPSAILSFTLPETAFTIIKIFDLAGREIEILQSENMAAGKHEVRLSSEGLSSGVYFYRIVSGSRSTSGKLVVSK